MNIANTIQLISVAVLPLILAITVHEAAHGWVANRLGDPTAKQLGRLTFNPIPHIDIIGTLVVPVAMMLLSGFIFGWAKPVPVNTRNFAKPREGMALVAVAGPLSNLVMAIFWGIAIKVAIMLPENLRMIAVPMLLMGKLGVTFNLILMILNLLPLPPLDGSRVLAWMLPPRLAIMLDRIEPYGVFILLGLLFVGLWPAVISPMVRAANTMLSTALGLPV
ncbi:MAG: site-2 protease family protein [Thiotrichales bacterium]